MGQEEAEACVAGEAGLRAQPGNRAGRPLPVTWSHGHYSRRPWHRLAQLGAATCGVAHAHTPRPRSRRTSVEDRQRAARGAGGQRGGTPSTGLTVAVPFSGRGSACLVGFSKHLTASREASGLPHRCPSGLSEVGSGLSWASRGHLQGTDHRGPRLFLRFFDNL